MSFHQSIACIHFHFHCVIWHVFEKIKTFFNSKLNGEHGVFAAFKANRHAPFCSILLFYHRRPNRINGKNENSNNSQCTSATPKPLSGVEEQTAWPPTPLLFSGPGEQGETEQHFRAKKVKYIPKQGDDYGIWLSTSCLSIRTKFLIEHTSTCFLQ